MSNTPAPVPFAEPPMPPAQVVPPAVPATTQPYPTTTQPATPTQTTAAPPGTIPAMPTGPGPVATAGRPASPYGPVSSPFNTTGIFNPFPIDGDLFDLKTPSTFTRDEWTGMDVLLDLNARRQAAGNATIDNRTVQLFAPLLDKAMEFSVGDSPLTAFQAQLIDWRPVMYQLGQADSPLMIRLNSWIDEQADAAKAQYGDAWDSPWRIDFYKRLGIFPTKFDVADGSAGALEADAILAGVLDGTLITQSANSVEKVATEEAIAATRAMLTQVDGISDVQVQRQVEGAIKYSQGTELTIDVDKEAVVQGARQEEIDRKSLTGEPLTDAEIASVNSMGSDYGFRQQDTTPTITDEDIRSIFQEEMAAGNDPWNTMRSLASNMADNGQELPDYMDFGTGISPTLDAEQMSNANQADEPLLQHLMAPKPKAYSQREALLSLYRMKPKEIRNLQTKLAYAGYFDELGQTPKRWGDATDGVTAAAWRSLLADSKALGVSVSQRLATRQQNYVKQKRRAVRREAPYRSREYVEAMASDWSRATLQRDLSDRELNWVWRNRPAFTAKQDVFVLGTRYRGTLGTSQGASDQAVDFNKFATEAFAPEANDTWFGQTAYLIGRTFGDGS